MLTTYPAAAREEALHATRKVLWIDLLDPTDEEKASVETDFGLQLPYRRELSEVESSSRISEKDGVLFLSMPIVANARALDEEPSPIGFVLSKDYSSPFVTRNCVRSKRSLRNSPRTNRRCQASKLLLRSSTRWST